MLNNQIADLFEAIADILDLKGENPFRVSAYRRAARSLRDLSEAVEAVAARDALQTLPGIGKDLALKIQTYIETGKIEQYEKLIQEFPPDLLDLLHLPGLGPKTLAVFHRKLGVSNADDLQAVIENGRLLALPGVKEKTVENLQKGLVLRASGAGRRLLGDVYPIVQELLHAVRSLPGVTRADAAGSVRRMRETIGDVDLVAASKKGEAVVQGFRRLPPVEEILAAGKTKGSVRLEGGLQVDLRVVQQKDYGAALHYFTGSQAHNVRVRGLARDQGFKINEYGVFRGKKRVAGATEEDVYGALGLDYIEPELREDRGEVEAADSHELPRLIEESDLRGDLHVHSNWSDGQGTLREVAEHAAAQGYAYVGITDHSYSSRVARGLSAERLWKKLEEVDALNREGLGVRILRAAEVDIRTGGGLDYDDDLLSALDLVIVSIHSGFKQSTDRMTGRILDALDHPAVHLLTHPTGRLIQAREAYALDLDRVLVRAAERGVALEINGNPRRLDLNDVQGRRAKEMGVLLALGTDAHRLDTIGRMTYAVGQARRAWVEKKDVVNTKTLKQFLKWLDRRRT